MLKEVWLNIGVEKVNTHEGITIKALLNSGATGIFMDRKIELNMDSNCRNWKDW